MTTIDDETSARPSDATTTPAAPPVLLTIAGFDPSGGAGVLADTNTFRAFRCFATAAITSLTFQNTTGVFGATHASAGDVRAQVLPVVEDFTVGGAKTGMLPTRDIIEEVARLFRETPLPAPVVDPVVRSTSGYDLIDDAALRSLIKELLPLAALITPNIPEAERMTGLTIKDEDGMRDAARALRDMGARAVLVKGGHLTGEAVDLLDVGGRVEMFRHTRINTTSTHGTGCTLAAAIAACLAHKLTLEQSITAAKDFVTRAIATAPPLGHGHGPVNHNVRVDLGAKS